MPDGFCAEAPTVPEQLVSQEPQGQLALEIPVQVLALALVPELALVLELVQELVPERQAAVQGLEPVQAELQVPPPGDRQGS